MVTSVPKHCSDASDTSCVDPPMPDATKHLKYNYNNSQEVAFGDTVYYSCEEGYFFENRDMLGFVSTCWPGGVWTPLPNLGCISPLGKSNFVGIYSTSLPFCPLKA